MKSIKILIVLLSLSLVSCKKDQFKITHKKSMSSGINLKNITVVNKLDPICQMKTADYLKDTVNYKNRIYGFCSTSCKNTFNENPEKYAEK